MQNVTHVVGIDPGLVHTGLVGMLFDPGQRTLVIDHAVVAGLDTTEIQQWLGGYRHTSHIFIEGYRARSAFDSDARMVAGVDAIRRATKGTVLNNTGVVKVVRQPTMELLGVWRFATPTHHQDLRSAARIALLGMMKDEQLNRLLADVVRAHLKGAKWNVQHERGTRSVRG